MRLLQIFFGERGLLGFLVLYAVAVGLLLAVEVVVASQYPSIIPQWTNGSSIGPLLRDANSYFLGAQVTMVGLLFPIAIALVTLIAQREDASSTISDVQVYYGQTLAYRIGASGIALAVVLAVQVLWPAQFAARLLALGTSAQAFKILLTAIHLAWLVINFTALWHFLVTSLSFIRPSERSLMRRQFAAAVSIPRDLSDRIAWALYTNAGSSLLPESRHDAGSNPKPSVLFGSTLGDWGEIEVVVQPRSKKVLSDVWMSPVGWVVRRWWRRCLKQRSDQKNKLFGGPSLVFSARLGRPLPEDGAICKRNEGVPLTRFERLIVRHSFRFGKTKP